MSGTRRHLNTGTGEDREKRRVVPPRNRLLLATDGARFSTGGCESVRWTSFGFHRVRRDVLSVPRPMGE